ncbi:MAG: hypothetical protein K0S53_2916 [Bacteroidetes bacterium]|jgi:PKD repeat protein|nr:hypothetical protein [Bacteroidota bacterium]
MKAISILKNLSQSKKCVKVFLFILICAIASDSFGQVPMIRLKMKGSASYLDETILYYQEGATTGFDSEYDAYKIAGPNNVPSISQEHNSVLMQINGINPVASSFSINIKTTTNTTGNFTITATDMAFLPAGTCVSLNDQVTGASINILNTPYIFNLSNTTTTSRFTLVVTHFELPILTNLTQPHCQNINDGKFKVKGTTHAPWNYIWKDSLGTVIQSSLNSVDSDSLINLNGGNYHVEISSASNACYSNAADFAIQNVFLPLVSFTSPDTVLASIMQNYSTQNFSQNCENYSWTFGDGNGSTNDFEAVHAYSTPGLYETKLTGISSTGCMDSISKMIVVIDLATSIADPSQKDIKLLSMGDNTFIIQLNQRNFDQLDIELYNLEGQKVFSEHYQNLEGQQVLPLDFSTFNSGMYIVNTIAKHKSLNRTKILIR